MESICFPNHLFEQSMSSDSICIAVIPRNHADNDGECSFVHMLWLCGLQKLLDMNILKTSFFLLMFKPKDFDTQSTNQRVVKKTIVVQMSLSVCWCDNHDFCSPLWSEMCKGLNHDANQNHMTKKVSTHVVCLFFSIGLFLTCHVLCVVSNESKTATEEFVLKPPGRN